MDPLLFTQQAPPPPSTTVATPVTITTTTTTTTPTITNEPNPNNHTSHPPYDDMIIAAVTALNEREGSSKRAIGKYIETHYTNLPPSHSDTLAHHLKTLKSSGFLVMNKKSYMLPRSANDLVANNNVTDAVIHGSEGVIHVSGGAPTGVVGSGGVKRGRGRPPKPKTGVNGLDVGSGEPIVGSAVASANSGQPVIEGGGVSAAAPLLASLGLSEELPPQLGKRSRGRPKRFVPGAGQGGAAAAVGVKKGRGRPKGVKKGVGRPRKLKTVAGVKKGPGRPPKISQVNPDVAGYDGAAIPVAAGAAASAKFGVGYSPKPRGRPRKNVEGGGVGGNLGVPAKRPGRPPKIAGGIVKPTGRSVGRPKKNGGEHQQAESYEDVKRKLEFFQSKVMEAVGVLKPQVSSQAPVTVIAAIQELEGLAALDLNAPLREDPQLPPPQPQQIPPPTQQMPQHYFPPQPQLMAQLQLPQPQLMPQQQLPQAQPFLH